MRLLLPVCLAARDDGNYGIVRQPQFRARYPFSQRIDRRLVCLAIHQQAQVRIPRYIHGIECLHRRFPRKQSVHIQIRCNQATDNGAVRKDVLHVERCGRYRSLNELLTRVDGYVRHVVIAHLLERGRNVAIRVNRHRVKVPVCTLDHQLAHGERYEIGFRHRQPGDVQLAAHALRDDCRIRYQIFDLRPADIRALDVGVYDVRNRGRERAYGRPLDIRFMDIRCVDLRFTDLRDVRAQRVDLCPVYVRIQDVRLGNLGARDFRYGAVQFVRRDASGGQFLDFRAYRLQRFHVERGNQRLRDMRPHNARFLNVRRANGRVPDLQAAHGTILQLPCAHGIQRQFHARYRAIGELARGDEASFQRLRRCAQRNGRILAREAVVGVLRHAQIHFYADAPGNDFYRVAQENI